MKGKIAVEQSLTPVKEYLSQKGYKVEDIGRDAQSSPSQLQGYDAIVVTGLNSNTLGIQDTSTGAVVINADGLSPEEVAKELESGRKSI